MNDTHVIFGSFNIGKLTWCLICYPTLHKIVPEFKSVTTVTFSPSLNFIPWLFLIYFPSKQSPWLLYQIYLEFIKPVLFWVSITPNATYFPIFVNVTVKEWFPINFILPNTSARLFAIIVLPFKIVLWKSKH